MENRNKNQHGSSSSEEISKKRDERSSHSGSHAGRAPESSRNAVETKGTEHGKRFSREEEENSKRSEGRDAQERDRKEKKGL